MIDDTATTELRLYIDNNGDLYRQLTAPTLKNLEKHKARGVYSSALALRSFERIATEGAKRYAGEFAAASEWKAIFPIDVRRAVARGLLRSFEIEYDVGNRLT